MARRDDSRRTKEATGAAARLADVAALAGVSISTAGRVLRNKGWPVEETLKQRVLKAATQLSYVPNLTARTLRGAPPAFLGLVVGNMLDPYYGEIAETVTRHAETTSKALVMVCNMHRDPLLELDYCQRLWEHRVAGLILAGGGFDQFTHAKALSSLVERMVRSGVAVATLSPRDIDSPSFCVDNETVGRMAATELVRHGHRRIGILIGSMQNRALEQRLRGMKRVFRKHGVTHRLTEPGFGSAWSVAATADLFAVDPRITGLIAASSATSAVAIQAVAATGRSVPRDVSVIGIGGGALAEWSPTLTRIDLALGDCSRAALDFIAAAPARVVPGEPTEFRPSFVAGGSAGPAV